MDYRDENENLCRDLAAALEPSLSVKLGYLLGELLWDRDTNSAEFVAISGSTWIERAGSSRMVYIALVRGERRYWATTNKDPYAETSQSALGVFRSFEDAVTFCREFLLDNRAPDQLTIQPAKGWSRPKTETLVR